MKVIHVGMDQNFDLFSIIKDLKIKLTLSNMDNTAYLTEPFQKHSWLMGYVRIITDLVAQAELGYESFRLEAQIYKDLKNLVDQIFENGNFAMLKPGCYII